MAVTINSQTRTVFGNKRTLLVNLDIGADADTWDSGLVSVDLASLEPPDETAVGCTVSGGTITFQTGGAKANCRLLVVGV